MEKVLKKEAVVLNLFEKEKGFLFGEDVFVGMENSLVKTILTRNEAPTSDVEKALYEVEFHFNLLGLELKENNSISEDIVAKKVLEAYNPVQEEVDYEILLEGESVIQDETTVVSNEQSDDENQISFGDILESFQLKQQNAVSAESYKEDSDSDVQVEETQSQQKLSREEKRKLTHKGVMDALNRGLAKLAEISEVVKDLVDVSDTTVRNVLIELNEEGIVNQVKRGVYELVNGPSLVNEGINSEVGEEIESTDEKSKDVQTENVPSLNQTEVQLEKVERQPNPVSNPVIQQPIQQPVQQPIIQYVSADEPEEKVELASVYPPLYRNDKVIEEYLTERGVRKPLINWVIKHRSYNADRLKDAPQEIVDRIEKNAAYIGRVSVLEKSLAAMMRDQPLSLKGEAGTGKTTLVETISCLLNLPLFSINGSLESNKATLVGEKDIVGKGRLVTKDGQMTKAMKWGAILYIDEINMMRPDVLAIVNAATDHRKTFFNDVSKETVVGHKDYRFISAMNVGYAGVKKMNEATMDRTASIVLTYLGKNEMKTLLGNIAERENEKAKQTGSSELEVTDIVKLTKVYLELTTASKKGTVPVLAASVRNIILLAKLVPVLGYELALEMMLEKFELDESAQIVGVLSRNDLLNELGVDPDALIIAD